MKLSIAFTIHSVEFTKAVIDGDVSLGGSESACLGLARALQARGHTVHIFTTKLGPDAPDVDRFGVTWHPMTRVSQWALYADFDVAIGLRHAEYLQALPAKFRMLWCQDLMANDGMKNHIMSLAWLYDAVAYVSAYHRKQWEGWVPELAPIGWVTKNGHQADLAAEARKAAVKKPHQIIHISRPERALMPLMAMWPELRKQHPQATLALCRYNSMYDKDGWGEVCKSFDQDIAELNAKVGGITFLGELGKPALYRALAESAVMWYPGVSTFAETSCIAAIEAQACGTAFVGSFKGALPETVPGAALIPGVAEVGADYQAQSIAAVLAALDGCARQSFTYRKQIQHGLAHVQSYSYETIAAEWEAFLLDSFRRRYEANKLGILRRLDYDDDLVTAKIVADELGGPEAEAVTQLADRVIAGQEHTAEHYARFALDPHYELGAHIPRNQHVVKAFDGCRQMLDVACGNGAIAIALAQADPNRHITAVDFSIGNIEAGKKAAAELGVAHQITFVHAPVWDMAAQAPSDWLLAQETRAYYDGLFCGEFLEHVETCEALIDALEPLVTPMGRMVFTVPMGPLGRIGTRQQPVYRSHVHRFGAADLDALFGQKDGYTRLVLPWVTRTGRGESVGNWCVSYRHAGPTGVKPVERRLLARPYRRITAGLITNDTTDLRRCLDAVWPVVDEIVLGDTGVSEYEKAAFLAEFPRKTRWVSVGAVSDLPGGFSEARNRVLEAATGDWFFWIDSDEVLCGQLDLGKYLDGPVFLGYSIPQNHLYLDAAMGTDTPIRVFRKRDDIQFYGCVHEQPQLGDCNGELQPVLQLSDVQIAHTGYLHEAIRRDKCVNRNLPLLMRDQQMFPTRLLGKLLVLRDHANLATWGRERAHGAMTEEAKQHFGQVIALFEAHFSDPAHKYHALARPFYEQAIRQINGAIQIEIGIVGAVNGLKDHHMRPERVWARTVPQLRALISARVDDMLKALEPEDLDTAPVAVEPERLEATA